MHIDTAAWSGDGSFTPLLVDALREIVGVVAVRVEDAPASRADTGYNFIANEIFVTVGQRIVPVRTRVLGIIPVTRRRRVAALTLDDLVRILAADGRIGEPDYADEGMIQYLRTERIVAPYQTRGIKVVELVRIYRAGSQSAKAR